MGQFIQIGKNSLADVGSVHAQRCKVWDRPTARACRRYPIVAARVVAPSPACSSLRLVDGREYRRQRCGDIAILHPVLTEELGGMQGRHAAIAADHGVSRAVSVAAPADALRVGGVQRKLLGHVGVLAARRFEGWEQHVVLQARVLCS